MPPVPPAVSIIIVNWNTRDLLRGCLASIRNQTAAAHEVIVVDNASSDDSAEMVRAEFPNVVLIANDTNRGFAAANNQGLSVAQGRHLLLLNPDTVVLDHAIDQMLAWMAGHPQVGCAGCQVLEGPGVIQRTCSADHTPLNMLISSSGLMRLSKWLPILGQPWYFDWDRKSEREVDVVTGVFLLVPRAVLERVGPLDESFFVYAEEADWCLRIRNAGYTCAFTPIAQIIHFDGGAKSTAQIKSKMYIQLHKSLLIYARKHHGFLGQQFFRAIFCSAAVAKLITYGFLGLLVRDDDSKAEVRLSRAALYYHLLGVEPIS